MEPTILFRSDHTTLDEVEVARKYGSVVDNRCSCENSLVIGRYSVLPFYKELEDDLKRHGSKLINSYEQHKWIADFHYYEYIQQYTPKTWRVNDFYQAPEGKYVVKGLTNSRKFQWNTHMFADSKKRALEICSQLTNDDLLIAQQGIMFREYIPLLTYERGINDLPFTNEWRFFFYEDQILSFGYYWSIAESQGKISDLAIKFAQKIAGIASKHAKFFVVDIAQTQEGHWIVIEMNDGQMSGLSENNPHALYSNLFKALTKDREFTKIEQ